MKPAGRKGDRSHVAADGHSCPRCPHQAIGPAVTGSGNVLINGRPALRVDDEGKHADCCGEQSWTAVRGAPRVLINERKAHRLGDQDAHCGGSGRLVDGSPNVLIGEYTRAPQRSAAKLRFRLVTTADVPIPDMPFSADLPDGTEIRGSTDSEGFYELPEAAGGTVRLQFGARFRVTKLVEV
ncbi:MAG: PAAR domain-containing protein [Polyangiaceae bacterium]|nr:PAAR domain-containing protein [Polyangiaceae bacterium]